ncbi:hypothetical protein HHK36_026443 [Tetracentron sinense]|uniref:Stress response NST1-like protein n=1 Tax=Tetracentron sinense TaxID=13715 RepID=A0A834YJI2_TETSI|nr:hypothetical protein HHK36_026443 [Tetracentron sinense]
MELKNPNNGEKPNCEPDLRDPNNGETLDAHENHRFSTEINSSCYTSYVSAPSSPGRGPSGYFFSAPSSPMHFVLSSLASSSSDSAFMSSSSDLSVSGSFEFEFSDRLTSNGSVAAGSMISADELFLNGQIRTIKLSSQLQRPQILAPLIDLEVEDEDEESKDSREIEFEKSEESFMRGRDMIRSRNRTLNRKTRSMSPLRNAAFQWHEEEEEEEEEDHEKREMNDRDLDLEDPEHNQTGTMRSVSASSSRSSSSGRSSKRWIFLKDFLYKSKSEGRGTGKEKFWSSISSPAKEKKSAPLSLPFSSPKGKKTPPSSSTAETQKPKQYQEFPAKKSVAGKPANGLGKRRVPPSAHELHYTANRAQAEEMKKKTFLPYRQGLLGFLGFSSKGYGAMNGFSRTLNPVSSR